MQVSWSSSWRASIFMWRSLCGTKYRQCLLGCGPLFRVRLIFCATFCSFHVLLLYVLLCFCLFVCFPTDWGLNARLKAHLHDRKIEYRPLKKLFQKWHFCKLCVSCSLRLVWSPVFLGWVWALLLKSACLIVYSHRMRVSYTRIKNRSWPQTL